MPSQTCVHKYVFTDCHASKASVVLVNCIYLFKLFLKKNFFKNLIIVSFKKALTYLSVCFTNGQFMSFNLPNLKPATGVTLSPTTQSSAYK